MKKSDKIGYIVITVLVISMIIYSIWSHNKANEYLKNSVTTIATVTETVPGRGGTNIFITYTVNGKKIENQFNSINDTFIAGEKILINVSREYPDKYLKYLHKVK